MDERTGLLSSVDQSTSDSGDVFKVRYTGTTSPQTGSTSPQTGTTSPQTVYYARLSCLLLQEGTECMRRGITDNLQDPRDLKTVLDNNRDKFSDLLKNNRITQIQFNILYPEDGDYSRIDISLWLILARYITTRRSRAGVDWSKLPRENEINWTHDFIRLREIRNNILHPGKPELTFNKYGQILSELTPVLIRLGSSQDHINGYLERDFDPQQTTVMQLQLKDQYMSDLLMKAGNYKRQVRCLTVILTVLAILIIVAMALLMIWKLQEKQPCTPHMKGITTYNGILSFMPRSGWQAAPAITDKMDLLDLPVKMAVIFHTGFVYKQCRVTEDCCDMVKQIQTGAFLNFSDIPYNYLIGDDGVIYEGRGSQYVSAAAWGRNKEIISIALIGNFACVQPSRTAMLALYAFLDHIRYDHPNTWLKEQILDLNYTIYGHCQVNLQTPNHTVTFPDSPGAAIMYELSYWDNWRNDNITNCDMDKECVRSALCCKKTCT